VGPKDNPPPPPDGLLEDVLDKVPRQALRFEAVKAAARPPARLWMVRAGIPESLQLAEGEHCRTW
jgi:hypothetical protein